MDSKRRKRRLSLDLLQGFEAAARHLSFTRASHELSLTQSAVSREIKRLEEQLGEPLFVRVNRGLRLTDAGHRLYRAVGEAFKLIDEATEGAAASSGGKTLTVTTSAPLASLWLVPKLSRFFRLHPDVDVRTISADHKIDLDRERVDLAIRWAPRGASVPGGEPLFDVRMFPVCSPALARDRARPLRNPRDLARHVLLDLQTTTGQGPWSDWRPWFEAMNLGDVTPAGALRFSHYDQVVQAAIDGSGVAIGRYPHNARHLADGVLLAPFGREAVFDWGRYFLLIASRSTDRPAVRKFVAWLRDEVRQDTEALQDNKAMGVSSAAKVRTRRR